MANAIVVIVVIIIMLFAGKGAYKHLKGEGACCGGGSKPEIPKKKLDGTKLGEKTMKITGMHCENCVASVTRAINRIDGAAAKVNLKKGEAEVSYDREISNDELKKVVEDLRISRRFDSVRIQKRIRMSECIRSVRSREKASRLKCLKIFRPRGLFFVQKARVTIDSLMTAIV